MCKVSSKNFQQTFKTVLSPGLEVQPSACLGVSDFQQRLFRNHGRTSVLLYSFRNATQEE